MCAKRKDPSEPKPAEKDVAELFAEENNGQFRYDPKQKQWYTFDGTWRPDLLGEAFNAAMRVAEAACGEGDHRASVLRASYINAVLEIASKSPHMATHPLAWDLDRFLLGTPKGTVDLRTGQLRPGNPTDLISRSTSVAPAEDENCPIFKTLIHFMTQGDAEYAGQVKRWFGYTTTGDMSAQKVVYMFGPGGNGKGVLLRTCFSILGSYAGILPESTLVDRGYTHPSDVAFLRGLRLAMVTETRMGARWRENIFNGVSGADPMTARDMRTSFGTFRPECKLTIAGNTPPDFQGVNDAARRRLMVFPVMAKPKVVNPKLEEQLIPEYPAILRWLINGALEWQKTGLGSCRAVEQATEKYFDQQDLLARWIDEYVVREPEVMTPISDLYANWQNFLMREGEDRESLRAFGKRLTSAGYPSEVRKINGHSTRVRLGLGLSH